ncbi:hypothetical protein VP01_941g18 [Puccinia sorghi]|uniref:MoaB/Mog domain-containing protein n=1 Tax=Puccinia sorghi TaxID=27349 RepID=A0A0L6U6P8_9BASI|nr:hypothetical protein VP01_941g18 [Puccinia sorghi]
MATEEALKFPVTPYPRRQELETRKPVRTAACVIIGDEILNGKTLDTNSHHFAGLCFRLGIRLKSILVIPDDHDTIVDTIRTLSIPENHIDIIVTSGGIGPTHAKVFDPRGEMEYSQETIERMEKYTSRRASMKTQSEEQKKARHRMALFPKKNCKVLFVEPHLWVPIVCLNHNIFVLPGVPTLFQQLIQALLCLYIPLPPESEKPHRVLIESKLPESSIAPILSRMVMQLKHDNSDIKLGSYPNLLTGIVNISLIGCNLDKLHDCAKLIQANLDNIVLGLPPDS